MIAIFTSPQGKPLRFFVGLLAVWVGFRAVFWESPFPSLATQLLPSLSLANNSAHMPQPAKKAADEGYGPTKTTYRIALYAPSRVMHSPALSGASDPIGSSADFGQRPYIARGQQILWMAAMARGNFRGSETAGLMPNSRGTFDRQNAYGLGHGQQRREGLGGQAAPMPVPLPGAAQTAARWSGDSWLLYRPSSQLGELGAASGAPTSLYGASQWGGVLRYRPFARSSAQIYTRITAPLERFSQKELAIGLAVKPSRNIPLRVYAETRFAEVNGNTNAQIVARPSFFGVTEIAPVRVTQKIDADIYAQGGYVGGRNASFFVDGTARASTPLFDVKEQRFRLGIAAWGGAQKGAARVDIGPSLTMDTKIAGVRSRLALDYRYRVAGSAMPNSGISFTLSAGF